MVNDQAEEDSRNPFSENNYWKQLKYEFNLCACMGSPQGGGDLCYCQLRSKKRYAQWVIEKIDELLENDKKNKKLINNLDKLLENDSND